MVDRPLISRRIGMLSLSLMASAAAAGCAQPPYDVADTAKWRTTREEDLKKPDGWLSVAALLFLDPGVSTIGTDPKNDLVLPAGSGPAQAGTVRLTDDKRVLVSLAPGIEAHLN